MSDAFLNVLRLRLEELLAQRRGLVACVEQVHRRAGLVLSDAAQAELDELQRSIDDVDRQMGEVQERVDQIHDACTDVADAARALIGLRDR